MKIQFLFAIFFCFIELTAYEYRFAIAAKFRNEAPYFKEWVDYHHMAGTDHFWLYNDNSTDNWEEVLSPYIKKGLIEVFPWPCKNLDHHRSMQIAAYKDAILRGKGKTPWLAMIDLDEFILPMQEATIPKCLEAHFQKADAIYANWRCFSSGGVYIRPGESLLFKLIACSMSDHSHNCPGKSIIRPEAADLDLFWSPHFCSLKKGENYLDGSGGTSLTLKNNDLYTDGRTHTNFIRINHYIMRDENYFQNVRLARARNGYNGYSQSNEALLLEHNAAFSRTKDFEIIKFIYKYHYKFAKTN